MAHAVADGVGVPKPLAKCTASPSTKTFRRGIGGAAQYVRQWRSVERLVGGGQEVHVLSRAKATVDRAHRFGRLLRRRMQRKATAPATSSAVPTLEGVR